MRKVEVSDQVRSLGSQVWARIPKGRVGRIPDDSWGYQVVVSGAWLQPTFDTFRRVVGSHLANAFTMPVFGVAEAQAFGGGELSRFQPRAIDVLMPNGLDQYEVLKRYSHEQQTFATLPMVYPSGRRPAPIPELVDTALPEPASGPEEAEPSETDRRPGPPVDAEPKEILTTVRDVHGQMVILEVPSAPVPLYRVGTVLGERGDTVGRLVVVAVFPNFLQATLVEGLGSVRPGARVRFDRPKESS
ncbi:MAG: hypothetical protein HC923_11180 [Myxococcales bacterium]|nr:hypothetical protein [Myxococcales bacterium]